MFPIHIFYRQFPHWHYHGYIIIDSCPITLTLVSVLTTLPSIHDLLTTTSDEETFQNFRQNL